MSDEIIISGAFFDNSMPKWATEETIKKLGLEFKKDRSVSKKQQDAMMKLFAKLVLLGNKTEKSSKDQTKELKNLVKEVRTTSKASAEAVKELKEQTKELKKQGRVSGKQSTGSGGTVDTGDIESGIKDSNKWLEKIHRQMSDMSRSVSRNNARSSYSSGPRSTSEPQNPPVRREPRGRVSALRQQINNADDANNSRASSNLRGNARINSQRGGGLRESNSKFARVGKNLSKALGAIKGFSGAVGKIVGGLMAFAKKIPGIGLLITAVSAAVGAAMDIQDIMWTSHKDYMKLLRGGFNFTKDTLEDTRMDGIRFRKIIAEAGFTLEASMEVMSGNAALFNKIGLEAFESASQVAGAATDAGSFMNQMMMDRKDILGFTSEYLSMLVRIGDMEGMNQERRNQSIERFIRNTSDFSKVTGRSLEEIKKIMSSVGESADENAFLSRFGTDERDTKRNVIGSLKTLGPIGDILMKSVTAAQSDQLGLYANQDNARELQQLLGTTENGKQMFDALNNIVLGIAGKGTGFDEKTLAGTVAQIMDSIGPDGMQALGGNDELRQFMITNNQGIADKFSAMIALMKNDRELIGQVSRGERTMSTEVSSQEASAIQRLEQTIEAREVGVQAMLAGVANTEESRSLLMAAVGARQTIEESIMAASKKTAEIVTDTLPAIKKMMNFLIDDDYEEISDDNYESARARTGSNPSNEGFKAYLAETGMQTSLRFKKTYKTDARGNIYGSEDNQEEVDKQRHRLEEKGLGVEALTKKLSETQGAERDRVVKTIGYMASKQSDGVTTASMREEYQSVVDQIKENSADPLAVQDMITRTLNDPQTMAAIMHARVSEDQTEQRLAREKQQQDEFGIRKTRTQNVAQEKAEEKKRIDEEAKNTETVKKDSGSIANPVGSNTTPISKIFGDPIASQWNESINALNEGIWQLVGLSEQQASNTQKVADNTKHRGSNGSLPKR